MLLLSLSPLLSIHNQEPLWLFIRWWLQQFSVCIWGCLCFVSPLLIPSWFQNKAVFTPTPLGPPLPFFSLPPLFNFWSMKNCSLISGAFQPTRTCMKYGGSQCHLSLPGADVGGLAECCLLGTPACLVQVSQMPQGASGGTRQTRRQQGLFPVHVSAWKCPHLNRNDLTGMASPEPCWQCCCVILCSYLRGQQELCSTQETCSEWPLRPPPDLQAFGCPNVQRWWAGLGKSLFPNRIQACGAPKVGWIIKPHILMRHMTFQGNRRRHVKPGVLKIVAFQTKKAF